MAFLGFPEVSLQESHLGLEPVVPEPNKKEAASLLMPITLKKEKARSLAEKFLGALPKSHPSLFQNQD